MDDLCPRLAARRRLPGLEPLLAGGTPFFANAITSLLSPFTLPMLVLPIKLGLGVAGALKLWAAAFGTYLLVRELGLGFWPGVVAGISFSFCAFNVVWLSHPQTDVSVLLPAVLWAVERTLRRHSGGRATALGAVLAAAVAGGHPGTIVHLLAAIGIYVLARLAAVSPRRDRLRTVGLVAIGVVVGVLLPAVVLLPAAKLVPDSTGLLGRLGGGGWLGPSALRTLAFPDWWGRPTSIELLGPANFNERTLYAGTVALVLAIVGLTFGDWRRKLPLVAMAAFALAVTFHTPVRALVVALPGFDRVNDARIHLLFACALTVMSAFGLQALLDRAGGARRVLAVVAAGAAIAVIATISQGPSWLDLKVTLKHFRTGADFPQLPSTIALTSIGWFVLILAGIAVVVLVGRRRGRMGLAAGALAVLAAVDMVHFAGRYQPLVPSRYAQPPHPPVIAFLERHRDRGRTVGIGATLATDWQMGYRLRDARGYDPPDPDLRYFRLWSLANPAQLPVPGDLSLPGLTPAGLHVLSLLGARYVVAPGGSRWSYPMRSLPTVYAGRDATVWENRAAVPRALVPRTVTSAAGEPELLATVVSPGFDPRRDAVVEPGASGPAGAPAGARGTAEVRSEANAKVTLRARMASPGLVVLNDHWAQGWGVSVDGRSAAALRVNGVMRGVRVPAGEHRVVWRYRIPGIRLGAILSAMGLLIIAGLLLVPPVAAAAVARWCPP